MKPAVAQFIIIRLVCSALLLVYIWNGLGNAAGIGFLYFLLFLEVAAVLLKRQIRKIKYLEEYCLYLEKEIRGLHKE